jgi:ADP-ribose pyrophosphatase YjhB (NUDIX family)
VLTDVIPRPARGVAVHTDRVVYDVKITGGSLTNEVGGSSDLAEWIAPDRLAEIPLVPYVARVLGRPPVPIEPVPDLLPPEPVTGPVQRFAAYGLVTDPAGRILLTRIAEGYPGAGTWHLPGGGTDFGERAADGLLRELAEETGQRGRVTELIGVGHFHNPAALGPEGYPMDWHTVRAVYRVTVAEPTEARVTEAAGGSTADARWYAPDQAKDLRLNEFARSVLRDLLA